ncbi:MAG: ABC transporter ATP-binding protein [Nitrospiraceae bacterium]|nr:ABC transporter ATP-binding protein [Nitrospiraceae bacterium]
MQKNNNILDCKNISVRFGGVQALNNIDFSAREKNITAIIGPNGAGKTTLLNVISGFIKPDKGLIEFTGNDITCIPSHDRGKKGIARTFQNVEIFSNMSLLENVMTGYHSKVKYSVFDTILRTPRYWKHEASCIKNAESELEFIGMLEEKDMSADELSFGKQRLLEIARAIASKPILLLLDEPAAGLNIRETHHLGEMIKQIRDRYNITIVLVEHDMDLVMRISDRITALNFGEVIAEGTPIEIQKNQDVITAYLGVDE